MIKDPCKDCNKKEEDDYGLVCAFWCTQKLEYHWYMKGYKEGAKEFHKYKTMDEAYGDGSSHIVCEECGLCKTCKDCEKYGCKKGEKK